MGEDTLEVVWHTSIPPYEPSELPKAGFAYSVEDGGVAGGLGACPGALAVLEFWRVSCSECCVFHSAARGGAVRASKGKGSSQEPEGSRD